MYKYVTHCFGCLTNASFAFTKKRERMSCAAYSLTYFITPPEHLTFFIGDICAAILLPLLIARQEMGGLLPYP